VLCGGLYCCAPPLFDDVKVWIYLSMTVQHSSGSTLAMAREQEADTGSLAGPLSGQRA
jgi:hypothetical protein